MRKLIIVLVTLCATYTAISVGATHLQQERQEKPTRFGPLTVDADKRLLFQGRPLKPEIGGNNSLDLGEVFRVGDADIVLVTDNGGMGCPFLYYFITITEAGAKATRAFGTCAEVVRVKHTGGTFSLLMSGYRGPMESQKAQNKAARETHIFTFRDGKVLEDGVPVK